MCAALAVLAVPSRSFPLRSPGSAHSSKPRAVPALRTALPSGPAIATGATVASIPTQSIAAIAAVAPVATPSTATCTVTRLESSATTSSIASIPALPHAPVAALSTVAGRTAATSRSILTVLSVETGPRVAGITVSTVPAVWMGKGSVDPIATVTSVTSFHATRRVSAVTVPPRAIGHLGTRRWRDVAQLELSWRATIATVPALRGVAIDPSPSRTTITSFDVHLTIGEDDRE